MRIEPLQLVTPHSLKTDKIQNPGVEDGKTFGEFLTDALGEVNKLQHNATQASLDLATGKLEDVSQVVIAGEKASIALQLTMQVRNKVVEAYQEVMRMSV